MNASIRFLMWVATPLGALLGGLAVECLGLVPVLAVAAIATGVAALPLYLSPVWRRHRPPPAAETPTG